MLNRDFKEGFFNVNCYLRLKGNVCLTVSCVELFGPKLYMYLI